MDIFGVVGKPISHSLSPNIFNPIFQKLGIDAHYLRFGVTKGEDLKIVAETLDLKGFNITAPYKDKLLTMAHTLTDRAISIGVINILDRDSSNRFIGDNSDPTGVFYPLKNYLKDDSKIVLIGAGGASRSVLYALKDYHITIVNRTVSKAKDLALEWNQCYQPIDRIEELIKGSDIVISTLPDPKVVLKREWFCGAVFFDANYRSTFPSSENMRVISGVSWLIYQAIPTIEKFIGATVSYQDIAYNLEKVKRKSGSIAIIGFMGCGKTTYGHMLAKKMGRSFVDLDNEIERENSSTIPEIFEKYGEREFRRKESEILKRYSNIDNCIISCGGGVVESEENREILKKLYTVWIFSTFELSMSRIEGSNRPLLKNDLKPIYKRRLPLYAQVSELCIYPPEKKEDGVDYLLDELNNYGF